MNKKLSILITSILLFAQIPVVFGAAVFSDVASTDPHYTAITYLYDNGVIQGYPDNTFRPGQLVNRAEALKIILIGSKTFVPEIQTQKVFPDVLSTVWYGKYAAKAKALGIVSGDADTGFFRPGDNVKLAEALKILLVTNQVKLPTPNGDPYADVPKDAWFAPYFSYGKLVGLLDAQTGETVHPDSPVDRGLLAELMYRLATKPYAQADGKATYYGDAFAGHNTSSGEKFDPNALTAAHRTYPLGTWLKVTNVDTGDSVVVKVNDRGPYGDADRVIDLSRAAFQAIAPLSRGVIYVKIELVNQPQAVVSNDSLEASLLGATKADCPQAANLTISKGSFQGVLLDNDIPARLLLDETLKLKGQANTSDTQVSAFFVDSAGKQTSFESTLSGNRFDLNLRFPKTGTYQLGILPGTSGQSVIKDIQVIDNACVQQREDATLAVPAGLNLMLVNGDSVATWQSGDYNLYKVTIAQDGRSVSTLTRDPKWSPYTPDYAGFKEGKVSLFLRGAKIPEGTLIQAKTIAWSPPVKLDMTVSTHYDYTLDSAQADVSKLTSIATAGGKIEAVFKPKVSVRASGAVIMPNGQVKDIPLVSATQNPIKNQFGIDILPPSDTAVSLSYTTTSLGLHFIEINNQDGLAVINVPVYPKGTYPLLPNPHELSDGKPVDLGTNTEALRKNFLTLVNADRKTAGLGPVVLDADLSKLAQFRSDDMVRNAYFGHWDAQGRSANDLRKNYAIAQSVAENLAKDLTIPLAEYGLMRSAIHRSNILSPDWTRVGIGLTKDTDGTYIFVQIFSANPMDLSDITSLRQQALDAINAKRAKPMVLADNLNGLAQAWSELMVAKNIFDFRDPNGASLVDTIRGAGVNDSVGTYIAGNSSFTDALKKLDENAALKEITWKKLGVGIKQDTSGVIKITLIYSE